MAPARFISATAIGVIDAAVLAEPAGRISRRLLGLPLVSSAWSREQWEERRRARWQECVAARFAHGRIDYDLRPPSPDRFSPDGHHLADWARAHTTCCRKKARRVLALVLLGRADDTFHEVLRIRSHYLNRGTASDPCCVALLAAEAAYKDQWQRDFEPWWDAQPKAEHWTINVEGLVRHDNRSRWGSRRRLVAHISNLTTRSHVTLIWPSDVDEALPVLERLGQVYEAEEERELREGRRELGYFLRSSDLLDGEKLKKVTSDEEIFPLAWAAMERRAFSLIHRTLRDNSDLAGHMDDLIQEARMAVARALVKYKGRSEFGTYAYAAIRNALASYAAEERLHKPVKPTPDTTEVVAVAICSDPPSQVDGWTALVETLREAAR